MYTVVTEKRIPWLIEPDGVKKARKTAAVKICYMIRRGYIKRPEACLSCGDWRCKVRAFLKDPERPLKVSWWCTSCVFKWYAEEGRKAGTYRKPRRRRCWDGSLIGPDDPKYTSEEMPLAPTFDPEKVIYTTKEISVLRMSDGYLYMANPKGGLTLVKPGEPLPEGFDDGTERLPDDPKLREPDHPVEMARLPGEPQRTDAKAPHVNLSDIDADEWDDPMPES